MKARPPCKVVVWENECPPGEPLEEVLVLNSRGVMAGLLLPRSRVVQEVDYLISGKETAGLKEFKDVEELMELG